VTPQREPGGRGRIRTFVARKERQIYSLLVLATHPPVPRKPFGTRTTSPELFLQQLTLILRKNTKRTRVKRHQPVHFPGQDSLRPRSPTNSWWSWRRELNPRPSDYKSDALPAELRQRRSNRVRIAEEVLELQEVALKYRARGWPALWKIASSLDHLDTRYLFYPLYFSTESGQPL
jgi:hypothetical protein